MFFTPQMTLSKISTRSPDMNLRSLLRSASVALPLLICLTTLGAAQPAADNAAAVSQSEGLSVESRRYYMLFTRLMSRPSPNLLSLGSDGESRDPRLKFKKEAQLTDVEMRSLEEVARDCMSKMKEINQTAGQLIGQLRAIYGQSRPPESAPQRKALDKLQPRRTNLLTNALAELRARFGEDEFKRLDNYVSTHSGDRVVPPPPDKKPLPVQVSLSFFDQRGETSRTQFASDEIFILQVTMVNNSNETISVKPADVFAWLVLLPTQDPSEINLLFRLRSDHGLADEPIALSPNQQRLMSRVVLGMGDIILKPGPYQFTLRPKVGLNRWPAEGEWLALSLSGPSKFQIIKK